MGEQREMTRDTIDAIPRWPLQWPAGWKRTAPHARRNTLFKSQGKWVTTFTATQRLQDELERLGASGVTLSTNVELKLNGLPRSDVEPTDPGCAVYFRFRGRATVLACDSYNTVGGNIAAIAAHIEALRRIDRYGVGTLEQALAGYKALPADTAADWRAVLGFGVNEHVTAEQIIKRWKERARQVHPDLAGGSEDAMQQANRAKEFAIAEVTA